MSYPLLLPSGGVFPSNKECQIANFFFPPGPTMGLIELQLSLTQSPDQKTENCQCELFGKIPDCIGPITL